MDIGIIGGGINGLCCAWKLAEQGHKITVYERDKIMQATSRASSKLLHGGLRYLENREFRLVREALRERDHWLQLAPDLAKPLRIVMPIYKNAHRPGWQISLGLFLYDHLAGKSLLPKAQKLSVKEVLEADPCLNPMGLKGGYVFSDGQMDDYALGLWVADQARAHEAEIREDCAVQEVTSDASLKINDEYVQHDRLINVSGPWALDLLQRSGLSASHSLDLVRGSHLVLDGSPNQAYLLEAQNERRIVFVLPWKGRTLVGTTEVRQSISDLIICSTAEVNYLLDVYRHYFPESDSTVVETFAGIRPLLYSADDPNKATREYAIHRNGKLVTVLGGKWTTAMALANRVSQTIH